MLDSKKNLFKVKKQIKIFVNKTKKFNMGNLEPLTGAYIIIYLSEIYKRAFIVRFTEKIDYWARGHLSDELSTNIYTMKVNLCDAHLRAVGKKVIYIKKGLLYNSALLLFCFLVKGLTILEQYNDTRGLKKYTLSLRSLKGLSTCNTIALATTGFIWLLPHLIVACKLEQFVSEYLATKTAAYFTDIAVKVEQRGPLDNNKNFESRADSMPQSLDISNTTAQGKNHNIHKNKTLRFSVV